MGFYDRMTAMAKRQITSKGQALTIKRETGGGIDNDTGVYTPGVSQELDCYGVWLEITEQINTALGGTVQAGDRVVMLEATQTPQQGDKLSVDGSYWQIVNVRPVAPGGTPVVYYVQVRA